MKKYFLFIILFLIFNLSFAQTGQIDINLLKNLVDILQKVAQGGDQTQTQLTAEDLKQILPDEIREDDYIVQVTNFKITKIINNPMSDVKAVFFAVKDTGWRCSMFESEESQTSKPCPTDVKRPIISKELAIKITNETILLLKNRKRTELGSFKVGDKINIYGFMDKDNYGVEALIIRKIAEAPAESKARPIEITVDPKLLNQIIENIQKLIQKSAPTQLPTTSTQQPSIQQPSPTSTQQPSTQQPYIKVISPNGGEKWELGKTYTIRWESKGLSNNVEIYLRDDRAGPSYKLIATGIPNYINSYSWTIPQDFWGPYTAGNNAYKIQVREIGGKAGGGPGEGVFDESDNYFSIVQPTISTQPSIKVLSPNGGEVLREGDYYTIKWNVYGGLPSDARIYIILDRDDGSNILIASNLPASQREYTWKVTSQGNWGKGYFSNKYLVHNVPKSPENIGQNLTTSLFRKISDVFTRLFNTISTKEAKAAGNYAYKITVGASWGTYGTSYYGNIWDESDGWFLIIGSTSTSTPSITVTWPNGGETLVDGNQYTISWKSVNAPPGATVGLELRELVNGDDMPFYQLTQYPNLPSTGSFSFIARGNGNAVGYYKIRAILYAPGANSYYSSSLVSDTSDNSFKIVMPSGSNRYIRIVYPNGGETLEPGKTYSIEWLSSGIDPNAKFEINYLPFPNYGKPTGDRIATISNLGTFNWGSYDWTVPKDITPGQYLIQVIYITEYGSYGASDLSDAPFYIGKK